MRFDTHRISAFLVSQLLNARPLLEVTDDGGDLIAVRLASGEKALIYLIESAISLHEIKTILEANTRAGIHTLFILWCDLLLPADGQLYQPDEAIEALRMLGGNTIYAYDAFGADMLIFPVYFEPKGGGYFARHGAAVNVTKLRCEQVNVQLPYLGGTWRVADFESRSAGQSYGSFGGAGERVPVQVYYDLLGLALDADRLAVKHAYRRLARQYHPDLNKSPQAHEQMQRLNEAYEAILHELDED